MKKILIILLLLSFSVLLYSYNKDYILNQRQETSVQIIPSGNIIYIIDNSNQNIVFTISKYLYIVYKISKNSDIKYTVVVYKRKSMNIEIQWTYIEMDILFSLSSEEMIKKIIEKLNSVNPTN